MNEHPNYAAIEAERVVIFARLVEEQGKRKEYLQCLLTPAETLDGTSLVAFDTRRKPDDEVDDWSALVTADVVEETRAQYYVHRYVGPSGAGFIVGCQVVYEGQAWRYEEHHGRERRAGPFDLWRVGTLGLGEKK